MSTNTTLLFARFPFVSATRKLLQQTAIWSLMFALAASGAGLKAESKTNTGTPVFLKDADIGRLYPYKMSNHALRSARGRRGAANEMFSLQLNNSALEKPNRWLGSSKLNEIYGIDLSKTDVTDDWLINLESMPNLKEVIAKGTRITDKGVGLLSKLPALVDLDLRRTKIQGQNLGRLPHLKILQIGDNRFTNPTIFSQLAALHELESLSIAFCKFSWIDLSPKTTLEQRDVALAKSISQLSKLKRLDTLAVEGQPMSTISFRVLKELPELAHLRAMATEIDSRSLELLNPEKMRLFDLSYCTKINDAAVDFIGRCNRLNYLNLSHTKVSGQGVSRIPGHHMEQLLLSGLDLHEIQPNLLASMPKLWNLELSNTGLTDTGVVSLSKHTQLRQLNVSENSLSDACVPHLASIKTLSVLVISETNITKQGLERLKAALPKCKIIWG